MTGPPRRGSMRRRSDTGMLLAVGRQALRGVSFSWSCGFQGRLPSSGEVDIAGLPEVGVSQKTAPWLWGRGLPWLGSTCVWSHLLCVFKVGFLPAKTPHCCAWTLRRGPTLAPGSGCRVPQCLLCELALASCVTLSKCSCTAATLWLLLGVFVTATHRRGSRPPSHSSLLAHSAPSCCSSCFSFPPTSWKSQ